MNDPEEIFFDERRHYLRKDKADRQTRFWRSEFGRVARFEAILKYVPASRASILDIGCGTGDFLAHCCQKEARPPRYTGIDIVSEFIDEARERDAEATFETCDLLNDPWPADTFDWVIANGLFGHAQDTEEIWWQRFEIVTDRMWQNAAEGIALTLVSNRSDGDNPDAQYSDPSRIVADLMDRISPRIILDHSYLPNDFLVVLHRDSGGN